MTQSWPVTLVNQEGPIMRALFSISFVVAAVLTLSSTAALAQDSDKGGDAAKGKVKVYDFDGDTIDGDLIKPEGSTVDARDFGNHASLIRIRKDFIPEIIKSAEDL
jgi:hypothetical protein